MQCLFSTCMAHAQEQPGIGFSARIAAAKFSSPRGHHQTAEHPRPSCRSRLMTTPRHWMC